METKRKIWFKAKTYGWGWYPASWEGWVVTLAYVTLVVREAVEVDSASHSGSDTLFGMLPRFVIATAILITIAYLRSEKPR